MRDGQLTLKELKQQLRQHAPEALVRYDFGELVPDGFGSYRGDYSHLALGFREMDGRSKSQTVADLIKECEEADGQTFQGYKGRDFKMNGRTPVWVANYGHSTGTVIVSVTGDEFMVRLNTAYRDY